MSAGTALPVSLHGASDSCVEVQSLLVLLRRTYRRTNHSIYQCQVPIFPGYQLMSYASKPASRYHSMFITCPRSPMWTGRQNYYVTGAFRK